MVRTLVAVLGSRRSLICLLALFPAVLALLFLFVERTFIFNLIAGDFPLWLFTRILPSLAYDFLFSDPVMLAHYAIITILLSVYALLLYHLLVEKRYFSVTSIGTSLAGLLGISVGISCISCGALAGLLLISALGALSLPVTLAHNTIAFLMIGEALLVASIGLALYTLTRFER